MCLLLFLLFLPVSLLLLLLLSYCNNDSTAYRDVGGDDSSDFDGGACDENRDVVVDDNSAGNVARDKIDDDVDDDDTNENEIGEEGCSTDCITAADIDADAVGNDDAMDSEDGYDTDDASFPAAANDDGITAVGKYDPELLLLRRCQGVIYMPKDGIQLPATAHPNASGSNFPQPEAGMTRSESAPSGLGELPVPQTMERGDFSQQQHQKISPLLMSKNTMKTKECMMRMSRYNGPCCQFDHCCGICQTCSSLSNLGIVDIICCNCYISHISIVVTIITIFIAIIIFVNAI